MSGKTIDAPAEIKITQRKLNTLFTDTIKSAEAINLVYVTDQQAGIMRITQDNGFAYMLDKKVVTDEPTLSRIKSLVIPPAWQQVWICTMENGHLQATGLDVKNRKQYKYHPLWNSLRNQTKFSHMYEFGKVLPAIRERINADLNRHGLPLEKVLATIVSLMQYTSIRIGNSIYEKLNGSFGLTTLKDKHVSFKGGTMQFVFKGKKGVHHNISLKSKKLAAIVKRCRDIPGQELFQYYDEDGQRHAVDSGMVNNYIKEISGGHFTAKDFRTWAGTLHAIEAFNQLGFAETEKDTKKNIVAALDIVAKQLGNTRTVCKKYYVHPIIIDYYTNNTLDKYLKQVEHANDHKELSNEEQVLMSILSHSGPTLIS